MLDSKEFIPPITPAQALKSMQVMPDHSHNWYDGATTKESINDSSNNSDMKKLKENIHAIQVEQRVKAKTIMGKKDKRESVLRDLPIQPTPFLGHLKKQKNNKSHKTGCMIGIPKEIQEDEGDIDDGWEIMVKDVERLRQILIPTIHTLPNLEPVVQTCMRIDPVHDEVKVKKEEERDHDIPILDSITQPLTY
nr:hypothetical protein [Tanacetum cinerariifolium]